MYHSGKSLFVALTFSALMTSAQAMPECKGLKDDSERLACYDSQAGVVGTAPKAALDPIITKAKAAVANGLKDPPSARFESAARKGNAVCGYINAKNSYGGYTGRTRFVYVIATGEVAIEIPVTGINVNNVTEAQSIDDVMKQYCSHLPRLS